MNNHSSAFVFCRLFFTPLPILLGISLVGCESSSIAVSNALDYQQRIYNILEVTSPDTQSLVDNRIMNSNFKYPKRRQLLVNVNEIEVSWGTFLSLTGCSELQIIIGSRNNQLGQVMEPATHLYYELKLVAMLDQCLQKQDDFDTELQLALSLKQQQLGSQVWNNTWASGYWQMMNSSSNHQVFYNKIHHFQVIDQLKYLRALVSYPLRDRTDRKELKDNRINRTPVPLVELEWYQAYRIIESSKGLLYNLMYEIELNIEVLNQVDEVLKKQQQSICRQRRKTLKTDYLSHVLSQFYIARLQGVQGELIVAARAWEDEVAHWRKLFSTEFTPLNEWHKKYFSIDNLISQRMVAAVQNHVRQWQSLSEYCRVTLIATRD